MSEVPTLESVLPWIRKLAHRWMRRWGERAGADVEDLVQAGAVGAMLGLKTYDPEKGAITTHLTPWIFEYQRRAIEECVLGGMMKRREFRKGRKLPPSVALLGVEHDAPCETNDIERLEQRMLAGKLLEAAELSDRELDVLARIELRDESQADIGAASGVTRQRIDQIHKRALKKIRTAIEEKQR